MARLGHTGEGSRNAATRRDLARSREEGVRLDIRAKLGIQLSGRHISRVEHLQLCLMTYADLL